MSNELTLNQLQEKVDRYIGQFKEGYFPPLELLARLTEEIGELSREVQHVYGQKKKKQSESINSIEEELGDLFFVIVCFANAQGIRLDEALLNVINKFETRDKDRWTRKDEER
ncbi:NTP pyrophosphatase (non-canonical NTP hydrolase) [Ureibacillus xyleni]|uniref:NTP pyrophosphatase (Non-canonical NTP hydrolase) n=1 Tax=Ureibacillus xyleni TaxID=614648 RepID=A0A285TDE5_9BACL|nr:nucleotide pyrophosphohydrolase [Ureibacillus xyleni]SOC19961.1 NTP pyrophosphatase (non-canonical NTP hydrolase) [Ureibacillus xyleni]